MHLALAHARALGYVLDKLVMYDSEVKVAMVGAIFSRTRRDRIDWYEDGRSWPVSTAGSGGVRQLSEGIADLGTVRSSEAIVERKCFSAPSQLF